MLARPKRFFQTNIDDGRSIRALSGACLLSLAVAYGDTGKLLSAASAMLMSPRGFEHIIMPAILASLQRSVVSVMLGQTDHPGTRFLNYMNRLNPKGDIHQGLKVLS
jgi:hypothetical protein